MKIGCIINPASGKNRRQQKYVRRLTTALDTISDDTITHIITRQNGQARMIDALDKMAANKINVIMISGGDGTVQRVVSAITHRRRFKQTPLLCAFANGTTNTVAYDVGVRRPVESLIHHLATTTRDEITHHSQRRGTLAILAGHGADENMADIGFIFGIGLLRYAILISRSALRRHGKAGFLTLGARLVPALYSLTRQQNNLYNETIRIALQHDHNSPILDEKTITSSLLLATTLHRFPSSWSSPVMTSTESGFAIIICHHPLQQGARDLWPLLKGTPSHQQNQSYQLSRVSAMTLHCQNNAACDGRFIATADRYYRILPGPFFDFVQ